MENLEEAIRDLREKNYDLAQEVQIFKTVAAQKEKEKIELMKEINELRLKLSRLRSSGEAQAQKLDAALQAQSEKALSHLVQASGAIAQTIQLTKQYMEERRELDLLSPRWNTLGAPSTDKVHKVPPMLLGGQSIQPVVSLSRTLHNSSTRSQSNQNSSLSERTVPIPMHMLQDLYIPLQRIDVADLQNQSMETDEEADRDVDNSTNDLALEENTEQSPEESPELSRLNESDMSSRPLDAVLEDEEPENAEDENAVMQESVQRLSIDNPLEGPSWLLDVPSNPRQRRMRCNFEPDSTTPCVEDANVNLSVSPAPADTVEATPQRAFTPTLRRKRASTPPPSPSPSPALAAASPRPRHRRSSNKRVLKVVVAKMRFSDEAAGGDSSPPKRPALEPAPSPEAKPTPPPEAKPAPQCPARFDAPSVNGTTDSAVLVLEGREVIQSCEPSFVSVRASSRAGSSRDIGDNTRDTRDTRDNTRDTRDVTGDSDSGAESGDSRARVRRPRKQVSYKERSINTKLRR